MSAMLESAPLLLPLYRDDEHCEYDGFINVLGQTFRLSLTVPHEGGLPFASIKCDWKLESLLRFDMEAVLLALKESENLPCFCNSFTKIVEKCLKDDSFAKKSWTNLDQSIMQQIQKIGLEKVVGLSDDFSQVEIACYDKAQRQHKLKVFFDKENSQAQPKCSTDLPEPFDFQWSHNDELKGVISQFESKLSHFQEFWNCVNEIDRNTWVLEPEHPTYSCTYRRLVLGQNLSLHIVINPRQPSSLPECRILGAESAARSLKEKLNINLHLWDLDRSLLNNLQEVMEIDFPTKSDSNVEDHVSVDCSICYSHELGSEVPEIVCLHPQCSQTFHYTCLYEWLCNSGCRQSFNYLIGECPFCTKPMRLKIRVK